LDRSFAHCFTIRLELERIPEWIKHYEKASIGNHGHKYRKIETKDLEKVLADLQLYGLNSAAEYLSGPAAPSDDLKQVFGLVHALFKRSKPVFTPK
jgi:hypothetical protein